LGENIKKVVEKVQLQREKNKKLAELSKEKVEYFLAAKNERLGKVNEQKDLNTEHIKNQERACSHRQKQRLEVRENVAA